MKQSIEQWEHDHAFGTTEQTEGERRTRGVILLTLVMMVGEIAAGLSYGSMALLADGWHMGTHAAALGVTAFAYGYARRHAKDARYTFGTGKVSALGGFASAVSLAVVALLVFGESAKRLALPIAIRFDEAIGVAVLGLVVNLVSAYLLRGDQSHGHGGHSHGHGHGHHSEHHDHNLRAAYLHVLADALTSVLAIGALIAGKFLNWTWTDPMMGIVGSLVIAKWSLGLLSDTSAVLLDAEVSPARLAQIRGKFEASGTCRVTDLHVWRVGPRHLAAIVAVVTDGSEKPDDFKQLLADQLDLVHLTVEVQRL